MGQCLGKKANLRAIAVGKYEFGDNDVGLDLSEATLCLSKRACLNRRESTTQGRKTAVERHVVHQQDLKRIRCREACVDQLLA